MRIRSAAISDIDALLALELASFASDRLSRRQFRYMLTRAHAKTLVAEHLDAPPADALLVDAPTVDALPADAPTADASPSNALLGYVLVLFSRATSVARLYSIAVAALARGQGVGRALVVAAEQAAWSEERTYMRLEIRRDNRASQALFEAAGYRRFGVLSDYYADHEEALRYEKRLPPDRKPLLKRVPFYAQTLDFTCGPSSLMNG